MMDGDRALSFLIDGLRSVPTASAADASAARDWVEILRVANEQLLAPALWSALLRAGRSEALPRDARAYLARLHRLNGWRNRALRRQAVELTGALNEHGIVPVFLKGCLSLFDGCYLDPAVRMMRDLDILVPTEAAGGSITVLERLGYRVTSQYPPGHHAFGDFARPHDPGSVDLHFELVDPAYVLPAAEVWERAEPKGADGIRYLVPSATDRVLHNLLHAQIHYLGDFYRGELRLLQLYEFVSLARHFGPRIDWPFIERRMRAHRLTPPLESYALAGCDLFDLPWPLAAPPRRAARLHYRRCRMQLGSRALKALGIPWGNLRAAFAWHRMHWLYGRTGGALQWRCRHAVAYLRKAGVKASFRRLLRVS